MDWLEKASAIVNAAREKHGEQWKTSDEILDMVNALTKPGDAGKKLKDIREQQKGITDIMAINRYAGWYNNTYSEFGKFIDQMHAEHPALPIGVSEYGAGASLYQHEENPPVRNHQSRGIWHPEEWQNIFHEENWLQMKARPWIGWRKPVPL